MRNPARLVLRSINRLRSTIKFTRTRLGQRLEQRPAALAAIIQTGALLPGGAFSYGPVFDHLDAELAAVQRDLATAETAYVSSQYTLDQARHTRDQAAAALRDLHAPLQRLLEAHPQLGGSVIVPDTPAEPMQLDQQAKMTVEFLRDFERLPPAPVRGVTLDAGILAHDLEAEQGKLESQLMVVNAAESDVTLARWQADQAFAGADRVLSWVARTLESFSGLAGEEKLAIRIRCYCG